MSRPAPGGNSTFSFGDAPAPVKPVVRSGSHTSNLSKESPFSNAPQEQPSRTSKRVYDRPGHTPAPESIFSKQAPAPKAHAPYTSKKNQSTWQNQDEETEAQRIARATAAKKNQSTWNPAHVEEPEPTPSPQQPTSNPIIGSDSSGSLPGLAPRGAVSNKHWATSDVNPLSGPSDSAPVEMHFGKRRADHTLTETTVDNPLAPGTFQRPANAAPADDFKAGGRAMARGPSVQSLSSASNPLANADDVVDNAPSRSHQRKVAPDRNKSSVFSEDEDLARRTSGIRVSQSKEDTRARIFEAPAPAAKQRESATYKSNVFSAASQSAAVPTRKNPTFQSSRDAPWG